MFREREEAQADLGDFEDVFYRIPTLAWDRYTDAQRDERAVFPLRVQADIINAYMVDAARNLLAGWRGVTFSSPEDQGFFFDVFDKYRFRLHKLNDDFTIQNNSTMLALQFVDQEPQQLDLLLHPIPLTHLHLGYRLNRTKTGLASVHVVCPKGEADVSWEYALAEPETGGGEPRALPLMPTGGPKPRIKPDVAAEPQRRVGGTGA